MTATPDVLAGIPALPIAVAKVLEETGKDDPNQKVIAAAIESDAGLAAKMLSLVNSPYYGLNGSVTSLTQSVMIIGMRQVRNVALAVGALRSIPGIPPSTVERFLDRAMTTAKTARTIATKVKLPSEAADTTHLGGLLRGVGSLVALRMGNTRASDEEIVRFATMVLEYWKLPAPIVATVARSAGPFKEGQPASAAHAVYLASLLTDGRGGEADPNALMSMGMKPADLAQFDPRKQF
ncbi:HDOD domain-containing protein [bacterium]|nr:MAG: HDOD domain-containing protein [bacterium]